MIFNRIPKKMVLLLLGDIFLMTAAFFAAPVIKLGLPWWDLQAHFWAVPSGLFMILIYVTAYYIGNLYEMDLHPRSAEHVFRFMSASAVAAGITTIAFYFISPLWSSRGIFAIYAILTWGLTYLWRVVFEWLFKRMLRRERSLLIVGAGRAGTFLAETLNDIHGYRVIGFLDDDKEKWGKENPHKVLGGSDIIMNAVRDHAVDAVVIAITHQKDKELVKKALECKMTGIQLYDMPSFYEMLTGKVPVEHVNDLWFLNSSLSGMKNTVYNTRLKRVIDVALSIMGLLIYMPLAVLLMVIIPLESNGQAIFRQKRIGLKGREFELIKFRTMREGMENDREMAGKKEDPRITRIGRILRLTRLDEIPQMWNVLKGDMSFIGPRALIAEEVTAFEKLVPYFLLRHSVRPGITGWAQVNYRHGASLEDAREKLQYDLFYIKNLSPFLDFHILLKTVKVVLHLKGAN